MPSLKLVDISHYLEHSLILYDSEHQDAPRHYLHPGASLFQKLDSIHKRPFGACWQGCRSSQLIFTQFNNAYPTKDVQEVAPTAFSPTNVSSVYVTDAAAAIARPGEMLAVQAGGGMETVPVCRLRRTVKKLFLRNPSFVAAINYLAMFKGNDLSQSSC